MTTSYIICTAKNPLNSNDVEGNTLNLNTENGVSHEDTYLCGDCGDPISAKRHEECELCPDCEDNEIMGMKFGGV